MNRKILRLTHQWNICQAFTSRGRFQSAYWTDCLECQHAICRLFFNTTARLITVVRGYSKKVGLKFSSCNCFLFTGNVKLKLSKQLFTVSLKTGFLKIIKKQPRKILNCSLVKFVKVVLCTFYRYFSFWVYTDLRQKFQQLLIIALEINNLIKANSQILP